LSVHDLIARIYADDRFPPPGHFDGDLRMFAITVTWAVGVERAPKGERFKRVCEVMHLDNSRFWELIRADLPRYEPERGSDTGLCEAPMIRREGVCGKHGMQGFHVTNPHDGTWRLVSYCSRHRDVANKVWAAEKARKDRGDMPEPLPNRGGLLPSRAGRRRRWASAPTTGPSWRRSSLLQAPRRLRCELSSAAESWTRRRFLPVMPPRLR
jgi:hypothetical protein